MDQTLQLGKIFNRYDVTVVLLNVKGIVAYKKLKSMKTFRKNLVSTINLLSGKFDVYLNGKIMSNDECKEENFQKLTNTFQPYDYLFFQQVIFSKTGVCMAIFENFQSKGIYFGIIFKSLLISNRFNLIKTNTSDLTHLKVLFFELFFQSVTSQFLNSKLFYKIKFLIITRNVLCIESDLLREFKFLRFIDINILNIRDFFHTDTSWFKSSFESEIDFDTVIQNEKKFIREFLRKKYKLVRFSRSGIRCTTNYFFGTSFVRTYEFPTENICLFKSFPHSQLVLPIIIQDRELNCTCTI